LCQLLGKNDSTKEIIFKLSDLTIQLVVPSDGKLEMEIPLKAIQSWKILPVSEEQNKKINSLEIIEISIAPPYQSPILVTTDDASLLSNDLLGLLSGIAAKKEQAQKTAEILLLGGLSGTYFGNGSTNDGKSVRLNVTENKVLVKEAISENVIHQKSFDDVSGWVFGLNLKGSPEPFFIMSDKIITPNEIPGIQLIIKAIQQRQILESSQALKQALQQVATPIIPSSTITSTASTTTTTTTTSTTSSTITTTITTTSTTPSTPNVPTSQNINSTQLQDASKVADDATESESEASTGTTNRRKDSASDSGERNF